MKRKRSGPMAHRQSGQRGRRGLLHQSPLKMVRWYSWTGQYRQADDANDDYYGGVTQHHIAAPAG